MSRGTDPGAVEDVLTVADLNRRIGDVIDGAESLGRVRCLGEISDVSVYDWGVFLDLVYDDHDLTALLWANRYRELDVTLEPGMEVVVTGAVDFYAEDGRVNLKPWDVRVVGEGERTARLQRLRAELEARGWFDESHKQSLPSLPERIGVVTSLDGDARYDIQTSIHDRHPGVDVVIQDARVQGDHAPESVANAIHTLDRTGDVDVLVVGRGGGSETDLQAFDTEAVAEAVFTARTPVVAAVGHRDDEPLVYGVADATAITPTEAGAAVVPDRERVAGELAELRENVDLAYERAVERDLERLDDRLTDAYESLTQDRLRTLDRRLEDAYAAHDRRAVRQATARRYRRAVIALVVLVVLLLFALGVMVLV